MFTSFGDYDRHFALMDELRRRMARFLGEYETDGDRVPGAFPRINVFDAGDNIVLRADVPGLSEKDLQITANQDGITISGARRLEAREGYSVHRQERVAAKFARSLSIPWRVDPDKTVALVKDGVLTITLAKAPEAQPRQITVRAS